MALVALFAVSSMAVPAFAAGKKAKSEKTFARNAASGGMMEMQLGQMAQQKGNSQEVKDFGKRMETDHGKANAELESIISKKQMKMPAKLYAKHQKTVDKLANLSGTEFDKEYAREMVKDHTKDVKKFKQMSKTVSDTELKAWVDKTLPVLEQQLKHAKGMAQKLGATVKAAK